MGWRTPGRTALLVDLENLVRTSSGWLTEAEAGRVLFRVLRLAGPANFLLAVAPVSVLRRYVGALTACRVPCEQVPAGLDAADLALLAHSEHLASVGYRRFVVVSGDHLFATICRRHPTTVIIRHGQPAARALREAAVAVLAA